MARRIEVEKDRLVAEYVANHGRQPSDATVIRLRAQVMLATRPDKQVRSLVELPAERRTRASRLLGGDATECARSVTGGDRQLLLRADDVPLDLIEQVGRSVVEVVGEKRSTWRRWNLMAGAARQTMGWRFASVEDREAITAMIADAVEQASLCLTPPELAVSPVEFRRPDGTSVFRPKRSTVFSSDTLLAAEDHLLQRTRDATGPSIDLTTVETITGRPDAEGRMLGSDQAAALASFAVSGRVVDVLVGPAAAGKTTAMNALRRVWEASHGAGLAPPSRPGSSSSSTKPPWPAPSSLIGLRRLLRRRGRRCCWLATMPSSSPWTQAARSACWSTTVTMLLSWSMSIASPVLGRRPRPWSCGTVTPR